MHFLVSLRGTVYVAAGVDIDLFVIIGVANCTRVPNFI